MLKNTFCHIPGIGLKRERWLWRAGICSWDDCWRKSGNTLPETTRHLLRRHLHESALQLERGNPRYFAGALSPDQRWRLFPDFRHTVAYLDIETNGYSGPRGYITTIALYDGNQIRTYVRDYNLHEFRDDIDTYDLVVTYNGKCFDLPVIRDYLGVTVRAAHIDLMHLLRSLGYRGGLKSCERQLGLDRGLLAGVDGYFAVLLWQEYQRRDNVKALETLLAYNIEDVVNLEYLMTVAFNMKIRETPFAGNKSVCTHPVPEVPYEPDVETIAMLLRKYYRR